MCLSIIENDLEIIELADKAPTNLVIIFWWMCFFCERVVDQAGYGVVCFESVHG